MDIIVKDGSTFRQIINCLKELITESGEFIFNSEGISMQSKDQANVVLIDMVLNEDSFSRYKLQDSEYRLAINFTNLSNVLKLSKSMAIGMTHKTGSDKLMLQLNENNNKKIQFDMNLCIPREDETLDIHDIDYSVKVFIDSTEFQKSIKDLSSFGTKCNIAIDENNITFQVTGTAGTGEICMNDIEIEFPEANIKEFSGMFNIKYLLCFAKANLSNEVILKFGENVPFCFEYQLDYGYVRFYLTEMVE